MVGNLGKRNSESSYRLKGSKNMKKVCVDTNVGSLSRDGGETYVGRDKQKPLGKHGLTVTGDEQIEKNYSKMRDSH